MNWCLVEFTKGLLQAFDTKLRDTLRKALRLSNDTPASFFHAPLSSGGLGFMHLESIPRFTLKRIRNLEKSDDPAVIDLFRTESTRVFEQRCQNMISIKTVGEELCYTNSWRPVRYHRRTAASGNETTTLRTRLARLRSQVHHG